MGSFDVQARDANGHVIAMRAGVQAPDERTAARIARESWPAQLWVRTATVGVTGHGRFARRRQLVVFSASGLGGDDDGGLAGVREPRRPVPDPGSLRAEAELPR